MRSFNKKVSGTGKETANLERSRTLNCEAYIAPQPKFILHNLATRELYKSGRLNLAPMRGGEKRKEKEEGQGSTALESKQEASSRKTLCYRVKPKHFFFYSLPLFEMVTLYWTVMNITANFEVTCELKTCI